MTDLRITPTRRQLLEDIAAGKVFANGQDDYFLPAPWTRSGRWKVTADVRELVFAGLAIVIDPITFVRIPTPSLTFAGRKALNGGGPS